MYNPMQSQLDAFKKKNPPKATNYLSSYATQVQNKPPTPNVFNKQQGPGLGYGGKTDTVSYIQANKPKPEEPFDYYKSYFDSLDARESAEANKYGQAANNAVNANDIYLNQNERAYKNMEDQLKGQIPVMEKRSKKTQDLIKKGLESVKTQGERSKLNIQEQSGETLRGQAQTKREVDAKRNAIFAGNNTTDSFGVGGYQLEQTNADTDFMREQNMTLRDRDNQLANIETQIMGAETDAQVAIDDEIAKFEDAVRQIQFTLKDNEIAKQNAIENAYIKLQDTLFNITDSYNTNTSSLYEKRLELMKAQQEAQAGANQLGADKLSPEFIMSGMTQPSTYEDMLFMQTKGANTPEKLRAKQEIIGLVDSVLNTGIGGITGMDAFRGNIPGTKTRDTRALVEQIKNKLSLAEREKLRGQGTITEGEQEMLAKSVTALDYGMTAEAFENELRQIRQILGGGTQQVSGGNVDDLVNKYWN